MLNKTFLPAALLISCLGAAQSKMTFQVRSLPEHHPAGADIFLAGSFNGWNPRDEKFRFEKDGKGNYELKVKLDNSIYEYKITRGGWDKVECAKDGKDLGNRALKVDGDATVSLDVEQWKDRFPRLPRVSTASKNVHVVDTAFLIPQLNRVRRVLVYLPVGYQSSNQRYPVMYMHDGQNVFDDATSFAGEWGVDEFLDSVIGKKWIVVAVDNGENKRINEYCPWDFKLVANQPQPQKGEGNEYVDFLVQTLKPHIDKNYRTLKDKKNTSVSGSSMGGLISFFAVLKYPDVFGSAGVFSPAFWICKDDLLNRVRTDGKKVRSRIYFYGGKLEGPTMVPIMEEVQKEFDKVSRSKTTTVVRDDGKHNEPTWRKEFPLFFEWINR